MFFNWRNKADLAFKSMLGAVAALGMFAGSAQADVFVIEDPKFGYAFSIPDTWKEQSVKGPVERFAVSAPDHNNGLVRCHVKARRDGRLQMWPRRYVDEMVAFKLDEAFWLQELANNDNVELTHVHFGGVGKGDASWVKANYEMEWGDEAKERVEMTGLSFASIYGDKLFTIICEAPRDEYEAWFPLFGSIIGSVEFDKRYNEFATGYYRDFLSDPDYMDPFARINRVEPAGKSLRD